MRWSDERYVRVYTRDTSEWVALSWEARASFILILRAADRAGIIPLGKKGLKGLSVLLHMPADVLERSIMELGEDGCLTCDGDKIVVPNFIDAQEVPISDAQRKRDQRERDRARALFSSGEHLIVSPVVTPGHAVTKSVTPNRAVPNRTSRDEPDPQTPAPAERPVVFKPTETPPLGEELERVFLEERGARYEWDEQNRQAVRLLLKHDEAEILRRWRVGLGTPFPGCNAIVDLVRTKNWNAYGGPPKPPGRPKDARKGYAEAQDQDWTSDGGYGALNASGGKS